MLFKNNYLHFALLSLLSILVAFEFNTFIQTDDLIVQNLSDKYTQEIIANYLNLHHQWYWVTYIFTPIALYITTSLIALILLLVIELYYINGNKQKIKFQDTWKIVLMAQWSIIAAVYFKVIWFGFFKTKFTIEELQSFSPLSLINLFDRKTLDVWLIYPIQLFNVFEFIYWVILVIGIKKLLQRTWLKSVEMTLLSYGVALFIWVVVIMFVSLNFSLK